MPKAGTHVNHSGSVLLNEKLICGTMTGKDGRSSGFRQKGLRTSGRAEAETAIKSITGDG